MPKPDKKGYGRLGWLIVVPILLACAALGNFLGDMILICAVYGRQAYFEQGLRVVNHKPFTLSTGVVLSQHLDELGFLLDTALWLGLSIFCGWILMRMETGIRNDREHSTTATPR